MENNGTDVQSRLENLETVALGLRADLDASTAAMEELLNSYREGQAAIMGTLEAVVAAIKRLDERGSAGSPSADPSPEA